MSSTLEAAITDTKSVPEPAWTGLRVMRAMAAGELPPAPIAALMDMGVVTVEPGRVVFTGVPGARHLNPLGTVHGGFAATLLDSCMGCAVHTGLDAGVGYTTIDLHVTYLRPMSPETGMVTAEGIVVTQGRRLATATGTLKDARGKLIATATTRCMVLRD